MNISGGFGSDFAFQLTQGSPPADGIAFVIQDISGVAVGSTGGGMGYGGLERSLAVEFDTWDNAAGDNGPGDGDPDNNHIAVHTAGTGLNTPGLETRIGITSLGALRLADGAVHNARVTYDPIGSLSVYLDDLSTPRLIVPVNLDTLLDLEGGNAWIGFTAATGAAYENHDLLRWQMCPATASRDLSVTTTAAPSPVTEGEQLTLTNDVRNNGNAVASAVVLSDVLPDGVTFVSAPAGCAHANGIVTCALGDLSPGNTVSPRLSSCRRMPIRR